MSIHREGIKTITVVSGILILLNALLVYFLSVNNIITNIFLLASLFILFVVIFFFRNPERKKTINEKGVIAPADGTVVTIETTQENEYFKDKRIQVSIFMSVWNVHINRYPVSGKISYFKYHKGKYLLAVNPKSSEENERTSVVIKTKDNKEILYRQIAGIMARRIVSYAEEGKEVKQSCESGFIKFGSRVDIFLPLDAEIKVKNGDKTKGAVTLIAEI